MASPVRELDVPGDVGRRCGRRGTHRRARGGVWLIGTSPQSGAGARIGQVGLRRQFRLNQGGARVYPVTGHSGVAGTRVTVPEGTASAVRPHGCGGISLSVSCAQG